MGERDCCFNHSIGLPIKWDRQLPIFTWQKQLYDTLWNYKDIWIKKSTGLGATEFMLRYLAWMIVNNKLPVGAKACIVTGPRVDLAVTLIDRFKKLFENLFRFENKETVAELNAVRIEAFPSHHLDSMRGLTDVKFILLDEADFFPPGQQQDARDVSERYIAKSQPWIIMVSTPNAPEGLFEKIEREPDESCLYKRLWLPYTVGLPNAADPLNIYSVEEIEAQKVSPSFEREYNLKYLGMIGNVFHVNDIDAALAPLEEAREIMEWSTSAMLGRSMGLDPAWGSDSDFGIVITQKRNNKAEVFHAENVSKPRFHEVISHIMQLKQQHHVTKIYIDGANPLVVRELKKRIGEYEHYDRYTEDQLWSMRTGDMQIIPVNFQKRHVQMLQWTVELMQKGMIRIHPSLSNLVISLRTAVATEGKLNKDETSYNDLLDGLRLSMLNYEKPVQ